MTKALSVRRWRLEAVILAAGSSSRLGRPKQLLRVGIEPLIVRSLRQAREALGAPPIVVLGAGQLRLRSVLRRRQLAARIVVNPHWSEGMAGSLRTGLQRLDPRSHGALIILVDQALLTTADIARLAVRWSRRPRHPAAASYAGRTGAPAVIPRAYLAAARQLAGDAGARHLLRNASFVTLLAMPQAAFDVDTPAQAGDLVSGKARRG